MKNTLLICGTLFLAVVAMILLIPALLSTDGMRVHFARQLSNITGAELGLNGPVHFSLFPEFGMVANDLDFISADRSFAVSTVRTIASVRLLPLLRGRIQITAVGLDQPTVTLNSASGTRSAPEPAPSDGDMIELAASWLEELAIDELWIRGGALRSVAPEGLRVIAREVDLSMSAPGAGHPAKARLSAEIDGMRIVVDAGIGSLRDLLARKPAAFNLNAAADPPPHPALADLKLSGRIVLAEDGSYRIEDGAAETSGQPLRFEAAYEPGKRPYGRARISADTLQFEMQETAPSPDRDDRQAGSGTAGEIDLAPLRGFDFDLQLALGSLAVGNARAQGLSLDAVLREGLLEMTLDSRSIAGGSLHADLNGDLAGELPQFRGELDIGAVDLGDLAALAGVNLPANGEIKGALKYAFRGSSPQTIGKTLNFGGQIHFANGTYVLPQGAAVGGPAGGEISAINLSASIKDIREKLNVSGAFIWNAEEVNLNASVAAHEFASGKMAPLELAVNARPARVKFTGNVSSHGSAQGSLEAGADSLTRLLRWLGQDGPGDLGSLTWTSAIEVSEERININKANIALDDLRIAGTAHVSRKGKTSVGATLEVSELDLARFTGAGSSTGPRGASGGGGEIDLSVLREVDANIDLAAGKLGYGKVQAGPVRATLVVRDGIARLKLARSPFYSGTVEAEIVANGAGAVPAIEANLTMADVNALPLLSDAASFNRLEGKLAADIALSGSGSNQAALASSLGGKAGVHIADGAIRGIDVAKLINNLQSVVQSGYRENPEDRTEFTELAVSFDIVDGVARTDDLRLASPLLRMDGSGSLNLAESSIDMRLDPRIVASLAGQGGNYDVAGLGMPVIVRGPLTSPNIYPDIGGLLANPERALQLLSTLRQGMGEIGGIGSLLPKQGDSAVGSGADGAISGVLKQIAGGGGENRGNDAAGMANSLLRGMLGQDVAGPQSAAGDPAPVPSSGLGDTETSAGTIPVPAPNPRKRSNGLPPPAAPTGNLVDTIAPAAELSPAAGDVLKGLLNRLGN